MFRRNMIDKDYNTETKVCQKNLCMYIYLVDFIIL